MKSFYLLFMIDSSSFFRSFSGWVQGVSPDAGFLQAQHHPAQVTAGQILCVCLCACVCVFVCALMRSVSQCVYF